MVGQARLLEVCRITQRQGQVRIASWRRWTLEEVVCNQISPVSGSACLTDLSATKAVRTGLRRLNWFGRTQRGTNSADQTADDGLSGRGHPTRRTQTGCMDSPDRNLGTLNPQVPGSSPGGRTTKVTTRFPALSAKPVQGSSDLGGSFKTGRGKKAALRRARSSLSLNPNQKGLFSPSPSVVGGAPGGGPDGGVRAAFGWGVGAGMFQRYSVILRPRDGQQGDSRTPLVP